MSATRDPTDLRGHAHDAEDEDLRTRERRRREEEDFKWLAGHPQGRRVLARLLEETGVHRSTFNHSGSLMAYNEGRRSVGLLLMAELLELVPASYFKLLKEYQANE